VAVLPSPVTDRGAAGRRPGVARGLGDPGRPLAGSPADSVLQPANGDSKPRSVQQPAIGRPVIQVPRWGSRGRRTCQVCVRPGRRTEEQALHPCKASAAPGPSPQTGLPGDTTCPAVPRPPARLVRCAGGGTDETPTRSRGTVHERVWRHAMTQSRSALLAAQSQGTATLISSERGCPGPNARVWMPKPRGLGSRRCRPTATRRYRAVVSRGEVLPRVPVAASTGRRCSPFNTPYVGASNW
jgi:hypothetical protein